MFKKAAGYFRGAYIYKRIQGFLNEIFEGIERKDVKLRGELLEGASFTLTNLVLRPALLAALNLPMILKSGTIGKLTISGLDSAAARSGKITISISDVTFIFVCPSEAEDLTHEHVIAARRTLLDMMSVRGMAYWSDSSLQGFLETAFGAAEWESNEKNDKKAKRKPTPKVSEEAATRARYFEWMEYVYKNVELVMTGLHIRFEGACSKTGKVQAVGLTLPGLRFRPTESQNILPGTVTTDAAKANKTLPPNVKQMFRLFVLQNFAVYVDVEADSYLDELFPRKMSTTDIDDTQTEISQEEKKEKAAKREGERRVTWLRHQWSHDTHDALLFPVNTSTLSTFQYDPKGAKTLINDSVQVKVGPVRLCFGMAQLNALGDMLNLVMRRMRRSETLQFLYLDAVNNKHLVDRVSLPPFAKPPPPGSVLPLPCNVQPSDRHESGRSAINWNRKLFGDRGWARGMWKWSFACVCNDLKSNKESSNMQLLAKSMVDGSFLTLVDLYKKRHAEAVKLAAALAACAANQRRGSRGGQENDGEGGEEKASVFVPLLLTDPLEDEDEWVLGGLEVSIQPRVSLLARRVASLELTLEGRREPLTITERKLLAADYVRFVEWKKQGVFLSHMGQFMSSAILPEAVAGRITHVPLPPPAAAAATNEKGKHGNRWLFGFGGGGGKKKRPVKVDQVKVDAYGDLVDAVEVVFQTKYKELIAEGNPHEKAKLIAQRLANTEKEARMVAFKEMFPDDDEEDEHKVMSTPSKNEMTFATPVKTSPKYNFSADNASNEETGATAEDSQPRQKEPVSEEASFMQQVGFGSDDEDDSDDEAALDQANIPAVPPKPTVSSPTPPVPPKPTASSPAPPVPPKPTVSSPAPPVPPKPTVSSPPPPVPLKPTALTAVDGTSEASETHSAEEVQIKAQESKPVVKTLIKQVSNPRMLTTVKQSLVRSLMFAIDGSVSVEFRVPTRKVKKQSLFRVGAEGFSGSLRVHSDHLSLGSTVSTVEVLHWLTHETIELNETDISIKESFEETLPPPPEYTSPTQTRPAVAAAAVPDDASNPLSPASPHQFMDSWLQSLGPVYLEHVVTKRRLYASNHCEWEVGVGGIDSSEARKGEFKDTVWKLVSANDMSGVVLDNVESGRKLFARKHKPRRNGRKKHIQHLQEFGAGPRGAQVFPDNVWNVTRLSRVATDRGSFRVIFKNEVSQRYLIAVSQEQGGSVGAVEKSVEMGDLEWEVIPINATAVGDTKKTKKTKLKDMWPTQPLETTEEVEEEEVGLEERPTTITSHDAEVEEERPTMVASHAEANREDEDEDDDDDDDEHPEVVASARHALAEGLITKQEFTKLIGHHMSFLEASEKETKGSEVTAQLQPEKNAPTLLLRSAPQNGESTAKSKFLSFQWKKFQGRKWELNSRSDHVIHAAIGPKLDALLSAAGPHLLEDDVLGPELAEAYEKKDALIESAQALIRLSHCGEDHKKLTPYNSDSKLDAYTKFLTTITNNTTDVDLNVTIPALRMAREFACLTLAADENQDDETPTKSLIQVEALQTTLVHRAAKVTATVTTAAGSKILSTEVVKSPRHMKWLEARLTAAAKQHMDNVALFVPELTDT